MPHAKAMKPNKRPKGRSVAMNRNRTTDSGGTPLTRAMMSSGTRHRPILVKVSNKVTELLTSGVTSQPPKNINTKPMVAILAVCDRL
jgi:hypothetical protein